MVGRQPSNVVIIDGEPFFLADVQGAPQWHPRMVPTQEGDPTVPRRQRWNDWSRGMGDSRGIFQGGVEYAENAYLGVMGRILPGPEIATIATAHDAQVTKILEVTQPANRVISFGGRYAKEINPATQTVAATNDFGGGVTVLDAQLFIDQLAIALGDSTIFQRRNAAGTYSANTLSGNNRYARAFGLSGSDLVRGRDSYWSKCSAADFYGTDGNWSTEYSVGDLSGKINRVFSHNRWDYVLKDEGFYTFDQDTSVEANVLTDLESFRSSENRAFGKWYDFVFLCTYAGLYRFVQQGAARTVGMEEVEINEASELLDSYPTAFAAFGHFAYYALWDGTSTRICMMRRARDGDVGLGSPFTSLSVIDKFTGQCRAMWISSLPGNPTLYYGSASGGVSYFRITRDGRPSSYRSSGTVTVRFSPTDCGSPMTVKYLRGVEAIVRNVGSGRSVTVKVARDEGSVATIGSAITTASNRFAEKFLTKGSNDSGRVFQFTIELAPNSTSTPVELRELILNYEERPYQVPGAVMALRMRDQGREGDVSSRKSAYEQRQFIEARLFGTIIDITDPYGDTYSAALSNYAGDEEYRYFGQLPQDVIAIQARKLAYS